MLLLIFVTGAHAFGMMKKDRKTEKAEEMITCDALMAKSLVTANEGKASAESERDEALQRLDRMTNKAEELQKELEQTTQDLTSRLKDANEHILKIQNESKEEIQQKQKEWDELARDYDVQMATVRHKAEMAVSDAKETQKAEIASLKKTHEELMKQKERQVDAVKTNYEKLASAVRAEALLNVTTIQTDTEASMKALIQQHEKEMATLKQETDASMKALIQQHKEKVATLQQEMNDQEVESKTRIEAIQTEAAERIEAIEKQAKTQISIITEEANIKIHGATQKAKELSEKLKQVERARDVLDKKYQKATQVKLIIAGVVCVTYRVSDNLFVFAGNFSLGRAL